MDKLDLLVSVSLYYDWLDEEAMSQSYGFAVMSDEEIMSFISYIIKRCKEAIE